MDPLELLESYFLDFFATVFLSDDGLEFNGFFFLKRVGLFFSAFLLCDSFSGVRLPEESNLANILYRLSLSSKNAFDSEGLS